MLEKRIKKGCISSFSNRRIFFIMILAVMLFAAFSVQSFAESSRQIPKPEERVLLSEGARHFGISANWKPAEWKISLAYGDHRAEILVGSDRLMVDDYLMPLSSPVRAEESAVTIALSDSVELFSRMLGRPVTESEIRSAGLIGQQKPTSYELYQIRNIRYISYPRLTRLIVTLTGGKEMGPLEARCLEGTRTLTVELPQSRFLQPPETIEVGDGIVKAVKPIEADGDVSLIVTTVGDKSKYEIRKFDDPPRVVVDIEPASPPVATDFLRGQPLPSQVDGWAEPPKPSSPQEPIPLTTIVIDPGHGGKDQGAKGHGGLLEKEVTLAIALGLKRIIEETPGTKAVLTRTGDYFVSLKERTNIANHAKEGMPADLFISIHTNAHESQKIGGFEAYYISDAIDTDAEATAALENAVLSFEQNPDDPLEPSLTPILWDLQFAEFVSRSSEFAFMAQDELAKRLSTRNRGVRQAHFIVLSGVAMPSILVEVGFISNRIEEAQLETADFRNKCAEALAAAVAAFKERNDTRLGLLNGEPNP